VLRPIADENPREHARLSLSHPPELFDRVVNLLGTPDALRFCQHNNRRPPTILRLAPNVLRDSVKATDSMVTPHERFGMVVIQPTPHKLLREWSRLGIAQAQDPTAASVADFCDIAPGLRILDRCCGLGTKTIQIRERLGESGSIVAIDPDEHRIERLQSLVAKRKLSNVHVVRGAHLADACELIPNAGFDRILIDVPCSNSGVLARRSAARYFQSESTLQSLQAVQTEVLQDTFPALAPRGLLIYSTCSIWPEENQQMVQSFQQSHPDVALLREASTLPSFDTDDPTRYHDGGYVAVLQRG
jgi:16S rRNA (cytosine967-C5)-methyltransferase